MTDTERNNTRKVMENCYKKTDLTSAVVTSVCDLNNSNSDKTLHGFSREFYEVNLKWNKISFQQMDSS